jgi:hypothetical protein
MAANPDRPPPEQKRPGAAWHEQSGAETDDLRRNAVFGLLRDSGHDALRNLQCEVFGDVVVVSGLAPSYFLKQMAQTVILKLGWVKGLSNQIEVSPESRQSGV